MYTKEQIRKIAKAHGGIKYIENVLPYDVSYEEAGIYPKGNILEGRTIYKKILTPHTDSSILSKWRLAINMNHNGYDVYVWFRIWHHDPMSEARYMLDYVFNGVTGKKMRRDGVWNLRKKMENRAHLVKMIEHEPQVQTPDCEICEGDIKKCTCK